MEIERDRVQICIRLEITMSDTGAPESSVRDKFAADLLADLRYASVFIVDFPKSETLAPGLVFPCSGSLLTPLRFVYLGQESGRYAK